MNRFATHILLAIVLLAVGQASSNSNQASAKKAEDELARWERDLPDIMLRRDQAKLNRLLADDFIGFDPAGRRLTKNDVVAQALSPDAQIESLRHENIQVRVFGDAAVATATTVVKGRFKGQEAGGRFPYMHVWIKRNAQWKIVAAQSSAIPEPPATGR